jgi:hypothetical protein
MNEVKVSVAYQGSAVCGAHGYMLKLSENLAAFYLDGWGDTGRIYPVSTSSSVFLNKELLKFPSICIEDGQEESDFSEIYFPEFEGWNVHAVSGGKTMAICLTKE